MPIQIPRAKPFLNRNKFVFSSLCEIRVCHLPQDNLQSWRDQALTLPSSLLPPALLHSLDSIKPYLLAYNDGASRAPHWVRSLSPSLSLCPRRCAHWFAFQMLLESIRLESSPDLWPQFINNYDRSLNFSSMRLMWLRFIDYFRFKRRQSATCLDVRQ